jgi:hypothetical protein
LCGQDLRLRGKGCHRALNIGQVPGQGQRRRAALRAQPTATPTTL